MIKKVILLLTLLLFSLTSLAQKERTTTTGKTTIEELKMNVYDKDSAATAVVLYEHANYYIDAKRNFKKTTDFYFRVKILKKNGFDNATIKIPFYKKEKVYQLKAHTYNLSSDNKIIKTSISKKDIFLKQNSDELQEMSFTLPNIKVGSVIEYVYSITSPYSSIDDWYFQSNIPKIKSDFTAAILGNYKYNIRLVGSLKLKRDSATTKKKCVYVPILGPGRCLILTYGIDDVPAFKEEKYMLSKKNYISKLSFELKSYTNTKGLTKNYTKTWKSTDKEIKNTFLDNQNSKKKYFKKKVLNDAILSIKDELAKATVIYNLIKNHFNWNGKYWPSRILKIKKAFENKQGNVFDINLSLHNSLQAANIESKLVLLATRKKGLPSKIHPVYSDFNYLVVKAKVNNKTYFLDATQKNMSFGLVQFEALNGQGRVMDFEKGSFWENLTLSQKTFKTTRVSLELAKDNMFGNIVISKTGYYALAKRNELTTFKTEDVLSEFETKYPNIVIDSFRVENLKNANKKLIERYKINIETDLDEGNHIRINPFFMNRLEINPFKLSKRDYPVDFGYPRKNTYLLTLKIPKEYSIKKLPKNRTLSLPNKGGRIIFIVTENNNIINMNFRFSTNKKSYSSQEYFYLKEFYNQIIKTQDTFIELEKK